MHLAYVCVIIGIISFPKYIDGGPMCYDCRRIPYPRDCDRVRKCGDHEKCYTSQYITTSGGIWFDVGCFPIDRCGIKRSIQLSDIVPHTLNTTYNNDVIQEDGDIITCDQCCDGEFCNSQGCGSQPLPPLSTRGPICFSCHQQAFHHSCDVITMCKLGEKCYLLPQHHGTVDSIYTTGCMNEAQCDTLQVISPSLVGKRQQPVCSGCCDQDYCNRNCSALQSMGLHQTSNPSKISTPSTSTPKKTATTRPSTLSSTTTAFRTSSTTTSVITSSATTQTTTRSPAFSTAKGFTTISPNTVQSGTTNSSFSTGIDKASCEAQGYSFYATYSLCYKIYRVKKTWQSARDACIRDGGDLIVFDNQVEKNYFEQLANVIYASVSQYERRFWVGASDIASEQHWIWVDGTTVDRAFFHPKEPNNAYNGEDCAAMTYYWTDKHTWLNDDGCHVPSDYACQLKHRPLVTSTYRAHNPNTCTNSHYTLVPSLRLCYHIYKNNPMTWEAAKNFCISQSARLLILKDAATENYFIQQHFYDTDSNHRYWLGGNDFASRHTFLWLDGQHLDSHLVWAPGEPNDYYHHERCLDFLYGYGRLGLNDDDCSKHLYFICEEPLP